MLLVPGKTPEVRPGARANTTASSMTEQACTRLASIMLKESATGAEAASISAGTASATVAATGTMTLPAAVTGAAVAAQA